MSAVLLETKIQHGCFRAFKAANRYELGAQMGEAFKRDLAPVAATTEEMLAKKLPLSGFLSRSWTLALHYFPGQCEQLLGYAAAAEVNPATMFAMAYEGDFGDDEHCTTLVTKSPAGRTLLAHNEDWDPASTHRLYPITASWNDKTIFELHYAGIPPGNSVSVSSCGLVHAVNSLPRVPLRIEAAAAPKNFVSQYLSEASDMGDVKARLKHVQLIPQAGYYSHTFLDMHSGEALNIENGAEQSLRRFEAEPLVHSNHYVHNTRTHHGKPSETSHSRFQTITNRARAAMKVSDLVELMSTTDGGVKRISTLGQAIIDPEERRVNVWMSREQQWVGYDLPDGPSF